MSNVSRGFIKQSIKLSVTLLMYFILVPEVCVAESRNENAPRLQQSETISQNNLTPTQAQQLLNEAEKLAQQRTIPSQLQALEKLEAARLKWQILGDKSQEALTLLKLGSIYKNIGATTPALERYTEALTLYRELKNRLQEALTLGEIASIYIAELEQGKEERYFQSTHSFFINSRQSKLFLNQRYSHSEKALEFYNQSLEIYQELKNLSGEANILTRMAQNHEHLNIEEEDQEKLLKQSLAIYQEIGDKQGQALVLGNLSELNLIEYRNDQTGWDLFNQARVIYQELANSPNYDNFTTGQAEANLFKIAVRYWWSDNLEKALDFHNQSLNIYQKIGDKQGEALTLFTIAERYSWLENQQKELEFYNQALSIYQEIGDGFGEAKVQDRLGRIYSNSGEFEKALEFYKKELEALQEVSQLYNKIGDTERVLIFDYRQPIVLFNLGNIYSKLEEYQKEVETYKQAVKIYQKWQDPEGETGFLIKVAEYYEKQENLERMTDFLNYAIRVYRETGNILAEANLLRDKIANLYFNKLGDSEKGFDTLNQALKNYQEIGDRTEIAKTLQKIGSLYLDLENPEKALELYSQAIDIYQEIQDLSEEVYVLRIVGKIYYESGNKEKALEAFNQAAKVYPESGNSEKAINILLDIGEDYMKWGEKETALEFYLQAIPVSQQLGDYKKEALILRMIGQLYYELEDPNKAAEAFNQARKVYQNNQDRSGEAWTLYEIGKSYTILGDFEKAKDSYQQALLIYTEETEAAFREERTLDILIRMSRIYAYLGEAEIALEYCKKSLNSAQNFPKSKLVRRSEMFREIGKLCYQIGEIEKASESFEQYWRIYQQLGVDREVTGLMRIGQDYTELGEQKQALEYFNLAKIVYQTSGFYEGEIDTLVWISRIYFQAGNYKNSLEYFNQGLRIAQKIENRSKQASILTEIGDTYSELGDQEKALEFYNQAWRIYQELGNYQKQTDILNKIGKTYQQSGDLEKALEFHKKALIISQNNDSFDLGKISRNIGKIYFELGELEKALEFYEKALNSRTLPSSSLYTDFGKVYSNLGELEQALQFFKKSLDLQENNYPESRAENHLGIARVERKQGNLDTALTQIKIAIDLIEETRTRKDSPEERLAFFASKQDYYEFYIDLLMELHQQDPSKGYDAEALNISERSKARSLLELLTEANTDIRKGVDPELVIQERSLQQQLDAVERRRVELYNRDYTLEEKTAIEQEREYLLKKYQEVQAKIREKSPSYAALTQPQPLTLEQIQQQILDDDTLLLQYALGENRSFLWAITKDNITSYQLPSKTVIEQAARAFFRQSISKRPASSQKLAEASESLYQMILAPIASQLDNQRLAIVSDGILHYLPFSALALPTASKDYLPLVVNHEIVHLPSASTLSILRQDSQQQEPAPKTIAIVADPVFSSEDSRLQKTASNRGESWDEYNLNRSARQLDIGIWERLPGTRTEAEAILDLVPESDSIYAFDFAANRIMATNPQLSQYQIIHFATHGLFNSINPELSGIILSMVDPQGNAQNGFLRLHDIFNLDFSADLVVLSACKTGLGQQVRGEGLVGLTRGFMYAGTPRVLVSLWDVDDAATAEMMTRFYRLMLQEKLSATEALRKAQLEMQTDTQWQSPYYWAAFTLQGEWR